MNNFTNNRDKPSSSSYSKHKYNNPYVRHNHASTIENVRELNISRLSSMSKTISNPDDQSNETVIDEGTKLLVGSVEQVMHWIKMLTILERTKILYQVFGIISSIKTGSNECEKIFCLHSEHKISGIVCVFYEIDRKMPSVHKGAFVLCTGHVKGKNKLQIFSIREIHENKNTFDRISLVSQWAVNDILIYKKKV